MKKCALIVAVAGMATALQAAPHESVSFSGVGSFNRWGVAGNSIQTATFTGTYSVAKINVSGALSPTVAGNFAREACIQVTSPTGQQFIINPFTATTITGSTPVPAGAFTQLPTAETAAGTWTFEFFEVYDDNAGSTTVADSTWDNITLTLDDATVAPPPAPIPTNPSATFTAVPSLLGFNFPSGGWTTLTFTVPPDQTQIVDTVVISGMGTAVSGTAVATANSLNGSPAGTMMVRVAPPWAPTTFTNRVVPLTAGTTSSSSTGIATFYPLSLGSLATVGVAPNNTQFFLPPFNSGTPAATSGPAAGTWTVQVMQNFATTANPAFTGYWQSLSVSLATATPPTPIESFTLLDGGTITKTGTFAGAGEKKWYKFTVPAGVTISAANGNALDVGMVGTALAPENDACLAIYSSTGNLFATSFNTGPGLLPQISFGQGIRNPQGAPGDADPGLPFDGANPNAAPPNNPRPNVTPGDYYVLLCNGDDGVTFRTGLFNADATTESNTGSYSVMFRSWLSNNTAPFDAPPATDLGTLAGPVVSQTATLTGAKRYQWYKFAIPSDANDTTGFYVDIDTANTTGGINDTNIALYDNAGNLKGLNDDIAPGWDATNPTGGNSALSFGSSNNGNGRDYTAVNPNMPTAFGADGQLTAGTYYLQVSVCCANYNANRFWVVNDYATTVAAGTMPVAIRSNYPSVPTCGPADLGGPGGLPGADGHLNNNDFIAFITYFFNQNALADLGTTGGLPGSDGLWNNNDFIAFINFFFNGSAACP
ncbi:MAG: GC-type dockerin domain-anchored protein [Phycisphaerales bacterium]